ncbi:hypothetical protein C8Q74DRAFT_125893 [Fomes fomentarius]|nr:hypothetical protein C8Q74DRAFT_125893 [Fomes fomentarius]
MTGLLEMSGVVRSKLDATLGATFLGFAFTCTLYGITSLQTWMYFAYGFKDGLILRVSVSLLWILDTLHVVFLTTAMYHYAVTEFGNFEGILKPVWGLAAMVVVSLISNTMVRGVFGLRILKLGEWRWFVPVLIIYALSLCAFGVGLYFVVRGLSLALMAEVHEFSWSLWAGLAADVAADGILTASQCLLLMRMKTGLESPDSAISLLIKYSINTGLLTSLCAVIALITFTTLPGNFVYFAFYFVYSKLYVNSTRVRGRCSAHSGPSARRCRSRSPGPTERARFRLFVGLSSRRCSNSRRSSWRRQRHRGQRVVVRLRLRVRVPRLMHMRTPGRRSKD